jgi:hypothetical protein
MNCDQVFSILTRGPFPSGESTDAAVEAHLSFCSECRHFADALRPDGSSDAETLIPEESRGLPYYWGLAATGDESTGSATVAEGRRTRRRRKPSFFERHEPLADLSGWQLAFAVLMGALLGTLLRFVGYTDGAAAQREVAAHDRPANVRAAMSAVASDEEPPVSHVESHFTAARNTRRQLEAKLGTAPECCERRLGGFEAELAEGERPVFDSRAGHHTICCTQCHNAQAPRFALRTTTAKIVRSCQVCHQETAISRLGQR